MTFIFLHFIVIQYFTVKLNETSHWVYYSFLLYRVRELTNTDFYQHCHRLLLLKLQYFFTMYLNEHIP